ncbi:MAG: DUF2812 domain-containing protein [Lachnospira sp.]|nr:DUF2812 domain-containing protein [Lachnospira sp.]
MARQTIRKWFWVWDFEKEEKWLNDMAATGWTLDGVGWCRYDFKTTEADEYTIRLEMLDKSVYAAGSQEYIDFVEQTGAEYVGNVIKWVYFRKKKELGEFELFSDIDSKIKHLNRIIAMLAIIGGANLLIGITGFARVGYMGLINIGCAAVLAFAAYLIYRKKKKLQNERVWRE